MLILMQYIAGSILGAKFGFNAIPEKYITGLRNKAKLNAKIEKYIEILEEMH